MPIEFRCPSCAKLLRTPDESAGKKAKCPQCGTIADVPHSAGDVTGDNDGFGDEGFGGSDFGGDQPAQSPPPDFSDSADENPFASSPKDSAKDTDNPYASPSAGATLDFGTKLDSSPRSGLPWETESKSVKSFWKTAKMVIGEPSNAFRQMRREGGLGDPILFGMAGGLAGGLATAVYQSIFQLIMFGFAAAAGGEEGAALIGVGLFQVAMNFVGAVIGGTIGVIMGMFIGAAITHVMLLMLKGANYPYETTFRVIAFVTGSVALFQIIPIVGQIVQFITSIIYQILGLSPAQDTTTGKACAAVLLPLLICCVVVALAFGAMFTVMFQAFNS